MGLDHFFTKMGIIRLTQLMHDCVPYLLIISKLETRLISSRHHWPYILNWVPLKRGVGQVFHIYNQCQKAYGNFVNWNVFHPPGGKNQACTFSIKKSGYSQIATVNLKSPDAATGSKKLKCNIALNPTICRILWCLPKHGNCERWQQREEVYLIILYLLTTFWYIIITHDIVAVVRRVKNLH